MSKQGKEVLTKDSNHLQKRNDKTFLGESYNQLFTYKKNFSCSIIRE